jgi:hypothetical protein
MALSKERNERVCCSEIPYILLIHPNGAQRLFQKKLFGISDFDDENREEDCKPIVFGKKYEAAARSFYEFYYETKVNLPGFKKHALLPWFGGTPDGVTETGILVEFKVPYMGWRTKTEAWTVQVQGYLELLDLPIGHLVQYRTNTSGDQYTRTESVMRDKEWWGKNAPIFAQWANFMYRAQLEYKKWMDHSKEIFHRCDAHRAVTNDECGPYCASWFDVFMGASSEAFEANISQQIRNKWSPKLHHGFSSPITYSTVRFSR